jgi:hypothetical protein
MGLDITAYKNIKIVEDEELEYYFSNTGFPQSNMIDLENRDIQIEFDEEFDFRAESYGGYNKFRNELCLSANNITAKELWSIETDVGLKFYWLINFTDCDGYIGTSYCKILYDEFVKYEDEVKSNLQDYYHIIYDNFKEAFRLGSDNGLVSFH